MKNIQILLLDDIINGDKIYTLNDVLMINILRNSDRIKDYLGSSVYMLLGADCNRRLIYIGLTTNIGRRIKEHLRKKDFWIECIFFLQDRILTKTEIEWLESLFIQLFVNNNMFDMVRNYLIPTNIIINEKDVPEINNLYEIYKLLLEVFRLIKGEINDILNNNNSKSIINRIAKAYKYIPEQIYNSEEDSIIRVDNAEYFDIGNGKMLLCKGSEVYGEIDQYKNKIENNILIKDIIVESEDDVLKIIKRKEN